MEAPERGALMLVRVVAVALIAWAIVDTALYFVICRHNETPVTFFPCFTRAWPLIVAIIMLIKAKALAQWVADKLDL